MKRTLASLVRRLFLALGIIGIITIAALFGIQRQNVSAASPSYVRVIHASPFVGTADVFVDGTKLLSSFQFGAVTDYVAVPAGPHKVQIALVGKGIGASVISETLAVSPGVAYTVAATGATPSSLALQVFIDNNLLSPGTAKLRVYQLSPDAGSVSMDTGGNSLLSGIGYQSPSDLSMVHLTFSSLPRRFKDSLACQTPGAIQMRLYKKVMCNPSLRGRGL